MNSDAKQNNEMMMGIHAAKDGRKRM